MTKSTLTQAEREELTQQELDKAARVELDPKNPANYNIFAGKPLPEEFENPPLGEPGHHCVDLGGLYNPEWFQIRIEKIHDKQPDPVDFPLGRNWQIPLNRWVDAPPEVKVSLTDAIETHHEMNATAGQIALGDHPERVETKRRRFIWQYYPSA